MGHRLCYTMLVMSNMNNDKIIDDITTDVCAMADKDIWNVINTIVKDYGIAALPSPTTGADGMIDALIKLKYDNLPDCPY